MTTQRRALLEGLEETLKVDPHAAEEFVYGTKKPKAKPVAAEKPAKPEPPITQIPEEKGQGQVTSSVGRVGLTTRIRTDFAEALKRASLERQLKRVKPNTQQDILEEALEPWLRKHGYLN
jgi:hypothetical protein